jgi:hypothetical protein
VKILDLKQGSQEWYAARLGLVTASEADALVTPLGAVRKGDGVNSYVARKVAEKLLGYSQDQLQVFAVDQGKIIETIALPWFEFEHGKKVNRVGFIQTDDGRAGCSPDGWLEDGSGLEVKSPQPPNHVKYLLEGVVPSDYVIQVQFSLWVTQAPYWTFVSYSMRLPALVVRVEPDPAIQKGIGEAMSLFTAKMDAALAKIAAMSG